MNILIKEKILVCYLITKFDDENTLSKFLRNYENFKSGYPHELLICFKLFDDKKLNIFRKLLLNINYTEFVDKHINNDFDLGSYTRVSLNYKSRHIFFLNSYSYPVCKNWLNMIVKNYTENSILATSASNQSLLSSIKIKKFYKFISYFKKLYEYKNLFYPFPNPHIRTTGFLIKGSDFFEFMKNKSIKSKIDTWKIESGKNSLTNHFKKLNFNIYVINSDGNKFEEKDWKFSETYNYLEKSKSIISDKHIRKYDELDENDKLISRRKVW